MARIIDAVTAVLVHGGDIFITRRRPELPAFPGFDAFPGGKVDKSDPEHAHEPELLRAHPPRLMHALARELQEELGWDLVDACASGLVEAVDLLGVALTPPIAPVRFNTHFFRVRLRERPALVVDPRELAHGDWASPAEFLRRYEAAGLLCAPPTLETIRALAADLSVPTVARLHFEHRGIEEVSIAEAVHGVRQMWVRSNTLPPAAHTNCFLLGDLQSHRVMVDPSPADDEEMERLLAVARRYTVHEIFLTHHHRDHNERADEIARRLQIPIGMSDDTRGRLWDRTEGAFFRDIPGVNLYREGDVLCRWQGQAVRVLAVPGHDEGQLALMADDRSWCIVGDLIQGVGTVVIARPEGNMRKYFESLRRIIALDPKVIYPSHGTALGGTYRLQETLKHRELREQQILGFHQQGFGVDDMLPQIYAGVDTRLWPLARMTIESHLEKLRDEGRI